MTGMLNNHHEGAYRDGDGRARDASEARPGGRGEAAVSRAFRCEVCDTEPIWEVTRIGDVATSWACNTDLAAVCDRLQRDFEVTKLRVTHHAKALEWAELGRILNAHPEG